MLLKSDRFGPFFCNPRGVLGWEEKKRQEKGRGSPGKVDFETELRGNRKKKSRQQMRRNDRLETEL